MAQDKEIQKIIRAVEESELTDTEKQGIVRYLLSLCTPATPGPVAPYDHSWLVTNIAPILSLLVVVAAVITWFPLGITIPVEMTGYINSALIMVLSYYFGSAVRGNSGNHKSQVSGE